MADARAWLSKRASAAWADPQLQWLLQPAYELSASATLRTLAVLALIASALLVYYLSAHVRRPHMLYAHTPLNSALVHRLSRLHRAYWPTPYLTHEVAQAAIGSFIRFDPAIKRDPCFEREIRRMADGELLALDWLHPIGPAGKGGANATPADAPIVFVCHGLAGHSDELNMQYLALEVRGVGARFVLLNRRGCAHDMVLQGDRMYEWGCTSDMREALAHIKRRYPDAPLLGVGYSAGSNLLTKYMGETGVDCLFDAGLSVANSYDVAATSAALHAKPFYANIMVNILQNLLTRNEATFKRIEALHAHEVAEAAREDAQAAASPSPSPADPTSSPTTPNGSSLRRKRALNLAKVKKVKSVLEWDEHFSLATCGQHFDTLDEFYAAQSTTPELIARIAVPLLNFHAQDDPIIPSSIVPLRALLANPRIIQGTSLRGGHLGFTEGLFPFNKATWIEKLTAEWVAAITQKDMLKMVRDVRAQAKQERDNAAEAKHQSTENGAAAVPIVSEERKSANGHVHGHSHGHSHGQDVAAGSASQDSVDTQAPTRHASSEEAASSHGAHANGHSHHRHPHAPAPLWNIQHNGDSHDHAHASSHARLEPFRSAASARASLPPLPDLSAPVARYLPSPNDTPGESGELDGWNADGPPSSGLSDDAESADEEEDASASFLSSDNARAPDLSPLVPATPHPQPHGFAAAAHAAPPSSAAWEPQSSAQQMDFTFDSMPSPSAPAAGAGASQHLSPVKRRKLDESHARAAGAGHSSDDEGAEEHKETRQRPAARSSVGNGSTPLKRKK